eukprot:2171481-Rhodomonas_salina.1
MVLSFTPVGGKDNGIGDGLLLVLVLKEYILDTTVICPRAVPGYPVYPGTGTWTMEGRIPRLNYPG